MLHVLGSMAAISAKRDKTRMVSGFCLKSKLLEIEIGGGGGSRTHVRKNF